MLGLLVAGGGADCGHADYQVLLRLLAEDQQIKALRTSVALIG
ncbi:hypothetical protein AB0J27_12780 [Micromonospora chokoriensis]